MTTNKKQAIKWATRGNLQKAGLIYTYYFDETLLDTNKLKVKKLTKYNKEWAEFLCKCRLENCSCIVEIAYFYGCEKRKSCSFV